MMSSAPTVTGLALDARLQVLYWLDSTTRRLVAGTLSVPPPRNPPIGPVVEAVSTMVEPIELPVGLAMEEGFSAGFEGALFWLDQRTPASLTKLWLNGSGAVPLVTGGLSSPRAAHYQLGAVYVADAGTGSLLVVEAVSGRYAEELVQDDTLRPSGRGASPCARMSTPGSASSMTPTPRAPRPERLLGPTCGSCSQRWRSAG